MHFIEHLLGTTKIHQIEVEIKQQKEPESQHEQIEWGMNPSCWQKRTK
jgi:hypothetical protein